MSCCCGAVFGSSHFRRPGLLTQRSGRCRITECALEKRVSRSSSYPQHIGSSDSSKPDEVADLVHTVHADAMWCIEWLSDFTKIGLLIQQLIGMVNFKVWVLFEPVNTMLVTVGSSNGCRGPRQRQTSRNDVAINTWRLLRYFDLAIQLQSLYNGNIVRAITSAFLRALRSA